MSEYEGTSDFLIERGKIGRHSVRETSIGILHDLSSLEDVKEAEQGDVIPIGKGKIGVSFGAYPCFAGVLVPTRGPLYLFHTIGDTLPKEASDLINSKRLSGGLVGGSLRSIGIYEDLLKKAGFRIIEPPRFGSGFSVAIVRRREISAYKQPIPAGIYYNYE